MTGVAQLAPCPARLAGNLPQLGTVMPANRHSREATRRTSGAYIATMAADRRQRLGRRGEELAANHLERHGWRIVERNFRTRAGEIDLIASRSGTLAFCEVKTLVARRAPPNSGPVDPLECVGPAKRIRVRRMARAWLAQSRTGADPAARHADVRLDVIGVLLAPDGTLLRLEHLESAF